MRFAKMLGFAAGATMALAPVAATANPATSLSIAPAAKTLVAPAPAGKKARFGGNGLLVVGVVAAVGLSIAALAVALDRNNNNVPVSR